MAVTSTAVPVKNSSSAPSTSSTEIGATVASMPRSLAISSTDARVTPIRMLASLSLVTMPQFLTTKRFSPEPSATSTCELSSSDSSNPRRCASFTARAELMYWPQALAHAGMALLSNLLIGDTVTRTPASALARYLPVGPAAMATVTGHSAVQTLSVPASKNATGRKYDASSLLTRTTSRLASAIAACV